MAHHFFLIQILLPRLTEQGEPFPEADYRQVAATLTEVFGGLTAYTHSPAEGRWRGPQQQLQKDSIVVYEVMARDIDRTWWKAYRNELERRFQQESVVIRSLPIDLL